MSSGQEVGNQEGRVPTRSEDPTGENRLPSMFSGGDIPVQGGSGDDNRLPGIFTGGNAPEAKGTKCHKKTECQSTPCGGRANLSYLGWAAVGLAVLIGVRIYRNQTTI